MLPYVFMFCLSFLIEACAVGYTISVSKDKEQFATVFSAFSAVLANSSLYVSIGDRDLLLPLTAGEILGTVVAMRVWRKLFRTKEYKNQNTTEDTAAEGG